MAITQLSDRGLAYYSHAGNDVVVDVTGLFTGTPVIGTEVTLPGGGKLGVYQPRHGRPAQAR